MKTWFAQFKFCFLTLVPVLFCILWCALLGAHVSAQASEESFQETIANIQKMTVPPEYKAKAIEKLTQARREVVVQLHRTEGQKKILLSRKPK